MRGVGLKNLLETVFRSEGSLDKGSKVENAKMHPYQEFEGSKRGRPK